MSLADILAGRMAPLEARYAELQEEIADPAAATSPQFPSLLRELGSLEKTMAPWR